MKKVLFVATVARHIKLFHIPYLKFFKENNYKTYVAASWDLDDNYQLEYCDKFLPISIQRSPYSFKNLKAIKELKKIIEKEQFEIIHCHTPMGAVVTRLAARQARKKYGTRVIYTAHGFHFYKGAPLKNWILFYPVEWFLAKYTDTLITINNEDYELAKKKFIKRCKDIKYVPGVGIDEKKFNFKMSEKEKKKLRNDFGIKENDFVLIYPARLDKNKNQIFLINVMQELVQKYENIQLLLPGNDELNGFYQNKIKEYKLEKNIHFLGHRNDIPKLLKISNLAVSSSLREGLPVNIIEAFCCGLPVVALNCRGMKDLIINDKNGFIVNSKEEFKKKILYLYSNDNIRKSISKYNLQKSKNYTLNNIIERMKNIYE